MEGKLQQDTKSVSSTKQSIRRSALRARNRRRAKDLEPEDLKNVQYAFDIQRSTEDVGRSHLLPRAEAVDGVLIRHSYELRNVREQIRELRRSMGMAETSGRPFLLRRTA